MVGKKQKQKTTINSSISDLKAHLQYTYRYAIFFRSFHVILSPLLAMRTRL